MRVASQRISARAASATEARPIGGRRGAPLLTMTRTTYDDNGSVVEHGSHVYRPARYNFEIALVER